jgi:archaellum component FlaF (FlaF/FlaG flagellin family)
MSKVRDHAQNEIERANERFKITSVTNSSNSDFRVSVLNYGDVDTKIVDIYANGETVTSISPEKGDGTIQIDEIIMFDFTISQSFLSEPIEFTLVSEKGTAYSMSWSSG